jgi:hypothetical protein
MAVSWALTAAAVIAIAIIIACVCKKLMVSRPPPSKKPHRALPPRLVLQAQANHTIPPTPSPRVTINSRATVRLPPSVSSFPSPSPSASASPRATPSHFASSSSQTGTNQAPHHHPISASSSPRANTSPRGAPRRPLPLSVSSIASTAASAAISGLHSHSPLAAGLAARALKDTLQPAVSPSPRGRSVLAPTRAVRVVGIDAPSGAPTRVPLHPAPHPMRGGPPSALRSPSLHWRPQVMHLPE